MHVLIFSALVVCMTVRHLNVNVVFRNIAAVAVLGYLVSMVVINNIPILSMVRSSHKMKKGLREMTGTPLTQSQSNQYPIKRSFNTLK